MKKIEIMGCGYIGLPTAITFTLAGYQVCGCLLYTSPSPRDCS